MPWQLDLVGVLAWVAMSLFVGPLGLYWWLSGDQEMLADLARRQWRALVLRRVLSSFIRRR